MQAKSLRHCVRLYWHSVAAVAVALITTLVVVRIPAKYLPSDEDRYAAINDASVARGYLGDERGPEYWCSNPFQGADAQPPRGQFRLKQPPKVLVANLATDYDRWEAMTASLSAIGWDSPAQGGPVTRWPATDSRGANALEPNPRAALAETSDHARYILLRDSNERCNRREVETLAELGDALTHRSIWQEVVDTGADWVVVLEDGAQPAARAVQQLQEFERRLEAEGAGPGNVDLVLLGWAKEQNRPQTVGKTGALVRMCSKWAGAHGYVVTQRGAQRLLQAHTRQGITSRVDDWMGEFNAVTPDFVVLRAESAIMELSKDSVGAQYPCWGCDARKWRYWAFGSIAVAAPTLIAILLGLFGRGVPLCGNKLLKVEFRAVL